jgi:hypothetical protein
LGDVEVVVNAIAQIVHAEPGTRIIEVEESTLWVDGHTGYSWRDAPHCTCEICDQSIFVNGDYEGGWWVQSAKITLHTTAVAPLCDILGGQVNMFRRICPDCLAAAQALHLRDRLRIAEEAITASNATMSKRTLALRAVSELLEDVA